MDLDAPSLTGTENDSEPSRSAAIYTNDTHENHDSICCLLRAHR